MSSPGPVPDPRGPAALNRRITLAARPLGLPRVSDFHLDYSPLPAPGPGEVLVRSQYLSLDPHLRPRLDAVSAGGRPLALGATIAGAAIGLVVASDCADLSVGDAFEGSFGWQEHAVAAGGELTRVAPRPAPPSAALGVLGLPGLTAYFGLLEAAPRRGETVVVSGATGAIGMIAGQVARLGGCRVVGLAGGRADASWLRGELGFDAVVATANVDELDGALAEHCPDGVDVYFDTMGGATTDAVLRRINTGARICACGQTSQDNLERPEPGPRWLDLLVARRARVQGFLVSAHAERFAAGREQLGRWLAAGELGYREDVAEGIEAAPQAFIRLLGGESHGVQLVRTGPAAAPGS